LDQRAAAGAAAKREEKKTVAEKAPHLSQQQRKEYGGARSREALAGGGGRERRLRAEKIHDSSAEGKEKELGKKRCAEQTLFDIKRGSRHPENFRQKRDMN